MGIEKKVISVRLDEALIAKLKKLALEENRTMSNLVETVLKNYVKNKDAR